MIIGLDFDNTIVSYDALFHRAALDAGFIDETVPATKTAVRDALRAAGREEDWTRLQGTVYGARMSEAQTFVGAIEFIRSARAQGVQVVIISHRSARPYVGEPYDLHAAARAWLRAQRLLGGIDAPLGEGDVYFETTKDAKLARIAACGCDHFLDDLPEILNAPSFPSATKGWWFAPHGEPSPASEVAIPAWDTFAAIMLGHGCPAICRRERLGGIQSESPCRGGANNRASRIETDSGRSLFVKRYAVSSNDPRDRFGAERDFYRYLQATNVSHSLRPIAWDRDEHLAVFPWFEGTAPERVDEALVATAMEFFANLQRGRQTEAATALPAASEACFTVADHLRTVSRRVRQLAELAPVDALAAEVIDWVEQDLWPVWRELENSIRHAVRNEKIEDTLPDEGRVISPSDFGFHNALVETSGELVFLDFEYAGWDDPAKLVADFFGQPERPVDLAHLDLVIKRVAAALPETHRVSFAERCEMLLPVYAVKWSCIMLNEFLPIGRTRREFALGREAAEARRGRQFERVRTRFEQAFATAS